MWLILEFLGATGPRGPPGSSGCTGLSIKLSPQSQCLIDSYY